MSNLIDTLREALEPFALASTEGVVKAETGYVTITTCAEYFHRAAAALATLSKPKPAAVGERKCRCEPGDIFPCSFCASPVPSGGADLLTNHFKCAIGALRIYDPAIADAIQQNYELHASPSSEATMTSNPMEELREQAAKECEKRGHVTSADAIRALPLPQAGEAAIRVAIWNGARKQGMSQEAAIALTTAIMSEQVIVSALSTPTETPTAAAPDDGLMGRYREVLEAIKAEGLQNHNTRCRKWWPLVIAALSTATGDEGDKPCQI